MLENCEKGSKVGDENEIALYARRWIILFASCLFTIATIFGSKSFTVANEIYAAYFHVSLSVLDWSCLGLYAGATIVTPIFAWLFYRQSVGFRMLSIIGILCVLVSYAGIILAVQYPAMFPLMVVANFLQGVAYTICFTVGTSFAVMWFPDSQVGIAIACNAISFSAGTLAGAIVPPAIFENVDELNYSANSTQHQVHLWEHKTRNDLFIMYTPVVGLLLGVLIYFGLFVTDLPPKPPSFALLLKRYCQEEKTFSRFLAATKQLFQDSTFVLCCVTLSIVYNVVIVEIVHITKIVAQLKQRLNLNLSDDVTGGAIVTGFAITCCIAAFLSAAILNNLKCYAGQALTGSTLSFLSAVGMTLALYERSLVVFCVCIFVYGISTRLFVIPLLEIITRHTYPLDEAFVSVWVSGCGCIALVFFAESARVIALHAPPMAVMIFMCFSLLFSFILLLFVRPKNKRGEIAFEETNNSSPTEKTKLLKHV